MKIQKSKIVILVLTKCSISAVFQIVQLRGNQKIALIGESLYYALLKANELWRTTALIYVNDDEQYYIVSRRACDQGSYELI